MPAYFNFDKDFSYSFSKDRFTIDFGFKGKVIIHIATVNRGYPKDCFGAYSSFLNEGGEIFNIMQSLHLEEDESMPEGIYLSGGYLNLIYMYPELEYNGYDHYPFMKGMNTENTVKQMCLDIQKFYFPIFYSFLFYPEKALHFIFEQNLLSFVNIRNPFTLCMILMGMSNDYSQIDSLCSLAKDEDNGFYDFYNKKNPEKNIIKPIMEYFKKR